MQSTSPDSGDRALLVVKHGSARFLLFVTIALLIQRIVVGRGDVDVANVQLAKVPRGLPVDVQHEVFDQQTTSSKPSPSSYTSMTEATS